MKSLSSPLNSTPVGPPPTTTQCRSLLFSSSEIPASNPTGAVAFSIKAYIILNLREGKNSALAYRALRTASSLGVASDEFPGHGELPGEKLHVH